jgi:D-beta-D-heptose 7-phosphate kinase/D-beta-D-heptose 1-phosphate adenosyltransferase
MSPRVPALRDVRVVVFGDVMLDHYWYGDTARISPEAPVPVVRVRGVEKRPGGAANVAMNVAALGATAVLAGVVGEDESARALALALERSRVVPALTHAPTVDTVTKMRVLSRQQQLLRLDIEETVPAAAAVALAARAPELLLDADAVVLSDYGKGTLACAEELIAACRAAGLPVLVDPKGAEFERYRGATLVTPNQAEFEAVVGACTDETALVERGHALREHLGIEVLLVTRGEHGMTLFTAGREALHLPARAREVFDVTGAGDTVIGVLAAALGADVALNDAARLANVAAGLVVGKLGAATATVEELEAALGADHDDAGELGVVAEDELVEALGAARARGETVVMTNGCFDLLHAGHVAYLDQARALGDRLVVAVNDDASVARLKGAGRPITPLAARMAVLAGLRAVDWVVAFVEDTPARLVERLAPDVLVKGGDYRPEAIAGSDSVRARGGRVEVLAFVEGFSTSGILARAGATPP